MVIRIAVAVVAAAGIGVLGAPHAASTAQSAALTWRAPETFTIGMLRVDHYGTPGRTPIIFIPALFCGASQWQRQIAALWDRYDIYALTLPGFDARPRDPGGNLMSRATADISTLIRTRHLDHPIIVGHSLGGTLAVLFGVHRSAEVRGIVAVEGGYPVAPTPERREEGLREATAPYRGVDRSAFGDSLGERMLQYVITSKSDADSVQAQAARSDPAAVVDWMGEAFRLDLTQQLEEITVPLVEIVPFDPRIDPYQGFGTLADKGGAYRSFLGHAPHGSLIMIENSRHFVMIDQPAAFDRALYRAIDDIERGA
jgi:pimeloyl-ACP methyl ester carboxylesterase